MMVLNKKNKIFVGKRIDTKHGTWQMPQGGIEDDETIKEAALRELKEETSITNIKILSESKRWFYYDVPEFLVGKLWEGRYRGQKQKWLLCHFFGEENEIDVTNVQEPEFLTWKWVDLEELPELVIDFKKKLYLSIVDEFKKNIANI